MFLSQTLNRTTRPTVRMNYSYAKKRTKYKFTPVIIMLFYVSVKSIDLKMSGSKIAFSTCSAIFENPRKLQQHYKNFGHLIRILLEFCRYGVIINFHIFKRTDIRSWKGSILSSQKLCPLWQSKFWVAFQDIDQTLDLIIKSTIDLQSWFTVKTARFISSFYYLKYDFKFENFDSSELSIPQTLYFLERNTSKKCKLRRDAGKLIIYEKLYDK